MVNISKFSYKLMLLKLLNEQIEFITSERVYEVYLSNTIL